MGTIIWKTQHISFQKIICVVHVCKLFVISLYNQPLHQFVPIMMSVGRFGEVVPSDKKLGGKFNSQQGLVDWRPPASHLFLQRFLPSGGHLGRRCALTGASFQQVNPGRSHALLVLEVEQHILVKGEELLVPSAVLRRLLTQVAAFSPFFTRDHRQKQRVPFVVADALLHFVVRVGREKKVEQSEISPQAHGRRWLR